MQFFEERLQVVVADLKEDANKEITLLGNKMTTFANIINEPNVFAISLDGEACVTNLGAVGSLKPIEKEESSVAQVSKHIGIKLDP